MREAEKKTQLSQRARAIELALMERTPRNGPMDRNTCTEAARHVNLILGRYDELRPDDHDRVPRLNRWVRE